MVLIPDYFDVVCQLLQHFSVGIQPAAVELHVEINQYWRSLPSLL